MARFKILSVQRNLKVLEEERKGMLSTCHQAILSIPVKGVDMPTEEEAGEVLVQKPMAKGEVLAVQNHKNLALLRRRRLEFP